MIDFKPLLQNIATVIIGKDDVIKLVVACLLSEGHVLVEDVPGTGKTMLARAMAQSIKCGFARIQGNSDLMPSDITGSSFFNQKDSEFHFRPGPVFTNVLLMDEINRATPRAQSALLEAMGEKKVSVEGATHVLPDLFMVLATMNPLDNAGTYVLPEAQLDRFMMKLSIGYLPLEAELAVVFAQLAAHPVDSLKPVMTMAQVTQAQHDVRNNVHLSQAVARYGAEVVAAMRTHPDIRLGAGPRGTLNLLRAAQAYAYLDGGDFVTPAHVQALAVPVLAHRLRMTSSVNKGPSAAAVLRSIVQSIVVPG